MIIKTLSRKKPSFSQLYNYMRDGADDKEITIVRNVINPYNSYKTIEQFNKNYKLLPSRKDGNAMYHDILSLPYQKDITIQEQKEILYTLANKYLEKRAEKNMAIGFIHTEKDHIHCHLMISSNEKHSETRHRISKPQLRQIQKEIELYKQQEYPQLQDKELYQEHRQELTYQSSQSKDREAQLKHRTKQLSRAEQVRQITAEIMLDSYSIKQLKAKLQKHHLQIYERGRTTGVEDLQAEKTGKQKCRYRMKRLGLETQYQNLLEFEKVREMEQKEQKLEMKREQELEQDFDLEM